MATELADRREKKRVLQKLNAHLLDIKGAKANIHGNRRDVRPLHLQPSHSTKKVCSFADLACPSLVPLAQPASAAPATPPYLSATYALSNTGEPINYVQAASNLGGKQCSNAAVYCNQTSRNTADAAEGGQHIEPRARYLARKYFMVWVRRSFGRVLPHVAGHHHTLSLERKVFTAWREVWWDSRREWKLVIRADCHNRYRLWQTVWKAWSVYVRAGKEKRRKKNTAQEIASRNLRRSVWLAWRQYVAARRQQQAQLCRAQLWSNGCRLRWAWGVWRRTVNFNVQRIAADILAVRHCGHSLQRKAWSAWVTALASRMELNKKVTASLQQRDHTLLQRVWGAWLGYTMTQRGQARMGNVAEQFHSTSSLTRYFDIWRSRYLRARQMAQFAELVTRKGKVARERRAFVCWKLFRQRCSHKKALLVMASHQYSTLLKRRTMAAFGSYRRQQLKQRQNSIMARQFALKKRLAHWWKVWVQRWEHCDEAKQLPLTKKAANLYQLNLLRRVTASWRGYVTYRKQRRASYLAADNHFKKKALPRYFAAMREFVVYASYKGEILRTAQEFRQHSLLDFCFRTWHEACTLSQNTGMMERMAILHREEIIKREMLRTWKQRTSDMFKHLEKEERALIHYQHSLKNGVFSGWRQFVHVRHVRVLQHRNALRHCSVRLLKRAWSGWASYVLKRRASHKRQFFARKRYEKVLQAKVVQAWKTYFKCSRAKKGKIEKVDAFYHHHLCRDVLHQWVAYTNYRRRLKLMKSCSVDHWRLGTMKAYFHGWQQNVAFSVARTQEEDQMVYQGMQELNKVRIMAALKRWRSRSRLRVKEKENELKASVAFARTLKTRCFGAWLNYHHLCIRKNLMKRQCTWFHNIRLLSSSYSVWRVELMHAVVVRQKTKLSLWHWSRALQRKAMVAWMSRTAERRQKAERYSKAMEMYRSRLQTAGVKCWIQYAAMMQDQRLKSMLLLQNKGSEAAICCVRRCAEHWRKVCRRRRREGPGVRDGEPRQIGRSTEQERGRPLCDEWNKLIGALQISDMGSGSRLPPRRPSYLHFPPSPEVSMGPVGPPLQLSSEVPGHRSLSKSPVLSDVLGQSTPETPSSCVITGETPFTAADDITCTRAPVSGTVNLPYHTQSFVSVHAPSLLPSDLDSRMNRGTAAIRTEGKPSSKLALDHPTLQTEVALIRCEIMKFYHLKTSRRTLQEQMPMAVREQDETKVLTLQQQISKIDAQLKSDEPRIRALTEKIQHLLSTCV